MFGARLALSYLSRSVSCGFDRKADDGIPTGLTYCHISMYRISCWFDQVSSGAPEYIANSDGRLPCAAVPRGYIDLDSLNNLSFSLSSRHMPQSKHSSAAGQYPVPICRLLLRLPSSWCAAAQEHCLWRFASWIDITPNGKWS